MCEALRSALAEYTPAALVIDLSGFEYRFGNWIGTVALTAARLLGWDRVCVVACGETGAALRSLWESNRLGQLIPLGGDLDEAVLYLASSASRVP